MARGADGLLFQRALVARPVQSKAQCRVEHGRRIDPQRHAGDHIKSIGAGTVAVDIVAGDTGDVAVVEKARIAEQGFAQRQLAGSAGGAAGSGVIGSRINSPAAVGIVLATGITAPMPASSQTQPTQVRETRRIAAAAYQPPM